MESMCVCVCLHDCVPIRYVSCICGYVTWVSMVQVCEFIGVFLCMGCEVSALVGLWDVGLKTHNMDVPYN